jgi:hypothetical protein
MVTLSLQSELRGHLLVKMARVTGLEPATFGVTG